MLSKRFSTAPFIMKPIIIITIFLLLVPISFAVIKADIQTTFTESDHNDLSGLQGGTSNEYYHLTSAQLTVVSNTNGTNTGDQNLSGLVPYTGATGNVNLNAKNLTNVFYLNTGESYTPTASFSPIAVSYWTNATLSKTLVYNEFAASNSAPQERSFIGFRNVMSRNTNDNQTATFTGGSVVGLQNQVVFGGTLTNTPTIVDRQVLVGVSNTLTDQLKWNKTGKSSSINVYGVQNIFTINAAQQIAGTATRNYYGLINSWTMPGATSTIANAYGIYLNAINPGSNTVTGNLYGVYQAGATNINIFQGSTSIGKTTVPTYTLDVEGSANFTGTVYYGALQANSPHALLQDESGHTRICMKATDGQVVYQTIQLVAGSYQSVYVADTTGVCDKVLIKSQETTTELMDVDGEPTFVNSINKTYEQIWTKQKSYEIIKEIKESLPNYETTKDYSAGSQFKYNGIAYEVIQEHTSQEDWKPDLVPALYKKLILHEYNEITAWVQPQGAHDCYPLNAQVTYNGKTWKNTGHNCNVWQPGVFGWVVI